MSEEYISVRYSDKCPHCSTYMRNQNAECPTCGTIVNTEKSVEANEDQTSNFAKNFGEDDFITCPSCRVVNSMEFDKCQTCGYQLIEVTKINTPTHV